MLCAGSRKRRVKRLFWLQQSEVANLTSRTKLLQELKEALKEVYKERLRGLYLFGSCARQEEDSESDLDVLIVLKDFVDYWEEIKHTGQVISELSLKYNVTISPVRVREQEWLEGDSSFFNSVRKESIAL